MDDANPREIYVRLQFSAETKIPVFILGVREGGISLAKSMRNDHPSQYVVKGFSTEETAMVGRFLLGCEVYSYDETLIGVMHKMNVKTLFVSPLVTEKFLEKQDMIDKLTAEGIKIMMMPKHRAGTASQTSVIR